jgi:transcriptional regulator with XRE-family HTH domain
VAVEKLKAWRAANKLSQRQAAAVMGMYDLPVSIPSIQSWEQRVQTPGKLAARALETFLEQHPKIIDAPAYGRWKSPNTRTSLKFISCENNGLESPNPR